jgi:hypothetical protein
METIQKKNNEVDSRLEGSVSKAQALKDSQLKKWADAQEKR